MEEEREYDPTEEIAALLKQRKAIDARIRTLKAMNTGYKRCSRCKKWKRKTPDIFSHNGKGGLRSTCKVCDTEAGALRRQEYRKSFVPKVYEEGATAYCSSHRDGKGAWLPVSHFSRNRSMKSGLSNQCKACKAGYTHQ